jgi:hypothetical protein
MATTDPRQLALQAVSRALADPRPKVLHGTKDKPGFFDSAAAGPKQAAKLCVENQWVVGTGQFTGTGKSKKELFQMTPAGIKAALENNEPAQLLGDAVGYLERNVKELEGLKERIDAMLAGLRNQKELVNGLFERLKPPDVEGILQGFKHRETPVLPVSSAPPATSNHDWLNDALNYLEEQRRRNPLAHCTLPELFRKVAERRHLTIGQFHDGLRELASRGQLRLHPFTGSAHQLQEEQYALIAGQEIKYYAERITSA